MPALSPTMTEGKISSWSVKEGDSFTVGQVLLQIETDKAQMDLEAPDDGIMGKILKFSSQKSSDNVIVGSPIAILAEEGDDLSNLSIPEKATDAPIQPKNEETIKSPIAQEKNQIETHKEIMPPRKSNYSDKMLSPSASYIVKSKNISNYKSIPSSGMGGRIMKGDVLKFISSDLAEFNASESVQANTSHSKPAPQIIQAPKNDSEYLVNALRSNSTAIYEAVEFSRTKISSASILTKSVVDSLNKLEMLPEFSNIAVFTSASGNSSPILLSSEIVLESSPESLETILKSSNHNSASHSSNIAVIIGLSTSNIAEISKKYETVVSIGNSYKLFSSDERQSILSGALDSILLKPTASTNAQKSTSSLAVDVLINSKSKKINHDVFLSSIKSNFSKLG
ncbi:putative pyruvate dehydrogenase protein X component, mitochondrial [Smittium culicis]|uniref:Putative pyruvate dehydrogenase protein X component, mitochondrial n=1 Tax=Smittium culicis TaxID=133412 RepID=A0A1R1XLB4_9FUNG|nr:putative pyruvate dehydrogenase protein X component, mitochondrial [Smittium culicis]